MENGERTTETDRTVEMRLPPAGASPPPGGAGGVASAVSAPNGSGGPGNSDTIQTRPLRVEPIFPTSTSLESAIPPGAVGRRPSPALDPIARARVSRTAKWVMLAGILLLVAWLPAFIGKAGRTGQVDGNAVNIAVVIAATIFATVIGTGLPRLILPNLFGKWHEAAEALRDWLIVGVLTGVLYVVLIFGANTILKNPADSAQEWLIYRLPLLLVSAVVGTFVGRALAIRREAVVAAEAGRGALQIVIPVILLSVLERLIEPALRNLTDPANRVMVTILGAGAALCGLIALGIITWSASADASLSQVQRRRGGGGLNDGSGTVDITLTVIGGRESGKTVLLAAAFYEWSTQNIGNLRISPASDIRPEEIASGQSANLEDVARELYVNNQFPVGTVSTQNLPFELTIGDERIARFTFLDYPGGAIAGRVADKQVIEQFWDRVADTDGIILIADMSYVRRAQKDSDWLTVRQAYIEVMRRLVDRNGKRRIVPVALVLTKCDEFIDPNTGHIDVGALREGLKDFQYDELEQEWRKLNNDHGPGFVEFSMWITSAITYSVPQLGRDGLPDFKKPFVIAPPPPPITPTGCASPLLWICAKVLRWNVTIFYDISTFLFGSSPRVRRRVEAVLEMERIAEERAGKA